MELDEPENIAAVLELHESVIEGKDAYESAARSRAGLGYGTASSETANTATNYNPQNLRLCYELADGRRLAETLLYQPQPKDAELLETVSNSVEGILSRKQPGHRALRLHGELRLRQLGERPGQSPRALS